MTSKLTDAQLGRVVRGLYEKGWELWHSAFGGFLAVAPDDNPPDKPHRYPSPTLDGAALRAASAAGVDVGEPDAGGLVTVPRELAEAQFVRDMERWIALLSDAAANGRIRGSTLSARVAVDDLLRLAIDLRSVVARTCEARAQVARLREALERIAHLDETEGAGDVSAAMCIARAALGEP